MRRGRLFSGRSVAVRRPVPLELGRRLSAQNTLI